jgi:hypothetical protein
MKVGRYILNEKGQPRPEPDLLTWAHWMESNSLRVASDAINEVRVSTVFLGLDYSWNLGPPILWETMVFGGEMNQAQTRCAGSREQAEAMHAEMVEKVKAGATTNK